MTNDPRLEAAARAICPDAFREDEYGCWTGHPKERVDARRKASAALAAADRVSPEAAAKRKVELELFDTAAAVAAERERCAKILDDRADELKAKQDEHFAKNKPCCVCSECMRAFVLANEARLSAAAIRKATP